MFDLPRWRFRWGANARMSAEATTGKGIRYFPARSPTKPPVTQGNTRVLSAAAAVRVFRPDSSLQLSLIICKRSQNGRGRLLREGDHGKECRRERKRLPFSLLLNSPCASLPCASLEGDKIKTTGNASVLRHCIDANSASKSWVSNLKNCFLKEFKYNLTPSVWKILVALTLCSWKIQSGPSAQWYLSY